VRQPVDVAACIVRSGEGNVLLAERSARQVSAGYWEIPGGKIDSGESPEAAAARELREEVGLEVRALRPWITYDYAFPTKTIRLHFFAADDWTGTPHGREGQRIAWVDPGRVTVAPILPSNERVLRALALPREYLAFDAAPASIDRTLEAMASAFASGTRFACLRATAVGSEQRSALARRAAECARPYDALVALEGTALEARRSGVSAHTRAAALAAMAARPNVTMWVAGCRTEGDLAVASRLGADAIALERGGDLSALAAAAASIARPVYVPATDDGPVERMVRMNGPSRMETSHRV
jgi:8-oxo-dGTP diphosphatase